MHFANALTFTFTRTCALVPWFIGSLLITQLLTTLSYIPDIMLLDEDLAVARAEKQNEWKSE